MSSGAETIEGLNFVGFSRTGRVFRVKRQTKAHLGLGNVDNTSDADKPVSAAMQAALDGKQDELGFVPVADDDPRLSDARTPTAHNHDAAYAAINHNHDATYAPLVHTHDYAATNHNHDGVYQPAGSYAAASHNHDGVYSPVGHTHNYQDPLVSGSNIKTINGQSILGSGNIDISGGSGLSQAQARQLTRR